MNVGRAVATGIAGVSIEDSSGDPAEPLFEFGLAVERIRAARAAIDASATGVLLVGRSEGFIVGRPDLAETIRRLSAYAEAGAECLYAPGIRSMDDIRAVVAGGRPATGQRPRRERLHDGRGTGRDRRPADQRGWGAGAGRLGRVPPGRDRDRRARDVHWTQRRGPVRGARRVVRQRLSGRVRFPTNVMRDRVLSGPSSCGERARLTTASRGASRGRS